MEISESVQVGQANEWEEKVGEHEIWIRLFALDLLDSRCKEKVT